MHIHEFYKLILFDIKFIILMRSRVASQQGERGLGRGHLSQVSHPGSAIDIKVLLRNILSTWWKTRSPFLLAYFRISMNFVAASTPLILLFVFCCVCLYSLLKYCLNFVCCLDVIIL